jgi:hypothetical protein
MCPGFLLHSHAQPSERGIFKPRVSLGRGFWPKLSGDVHATLATTTAKQVRQTDQLMAGAARIAFCHPGQAKRKPGS